MSSTFRQSGVTLIEAMISILVFSVGALGLAAMQLTAITVSGDSQQRSLAIWKAQELADRIKSNPALVADYVTKISNSTLSTLGSDTAGGRVICEVTTGFVEPETRCADYVDGSGNVQAGAACNNTDDRVSYDVWEVFCDPNSGAATSGDASADGSIGLTDLEVVLRQNDLLADGNDDVELYLEWLSRDADANENITGTGVRNIKTDLCGRTDVDIDSRLDVYCLRFRP
ncbi:MAG: type IV pilus assembly protein PilV [Cryomorphaceae bacterium]|jgi:type IV pilus assembly protein PilV